MQMSKEIPKEILGDGMTGLGRIVVYFSNMELYLGWLIGFLLKIDDKKRDILVAQLTIDKMIHLADTLLREGRQGNAALIEYAEGVFKQVREVEEERNRIMHSAWIQVNMKEDLIRLKYVARQGKGFKTQQETVSPQHLFEALQRIIQANFGLTNLLGMLGDPRFPNPKLT
jgi:hypothetical protein